MKAVIPNKDKVLIIEEFPRPVPGPDQILVKVYASALNYADTMQRRGEYPLRPGQTEILGVEVAGTVEAWGQNVTGFQKGQRVFGLIEGGAYAEYCVMEHQLALDMPPNWSFTEAAAVPEVFITAGEALFELGNLEKGQTVLIHAGGSGVGTAAIQLAHHIGATVFSTVGSLEKAQKIKSLGADIVINHKEQDFVKEIMSHTGNEGVDLVFDFIGGAYLSRNLTALKPLGCLILAGVLDGHACEIDLLEIILRKLQIKGIAMRQRPLEEKIQIKQRFEKKRLPLLIEGKVKPVIHSVYPLEKVTLAHQEMDEKRNVGKIILVINHPD